MTHASRHNPVVGFIIFIITMMLIVISLFLLTGNNEGSTPSSDHDTSILNDDADIEIDGDVKKRTTRRK